MFPAISGPAILQGRFTLATHFLSNAIFGKAIFGQRDFCQTDFGKANPAQARQLPMHPGAFDCFFKRCVCFTPQAHSGQALRLCQASDISCSASVERPVESAAPRRFERTCDVTKLCSNEIYLARGTSLDFLPERGVYEGAGSITSTLAGRLGLTEDTLWLVQKK
jgi:hypothetical protein